MSAIDSVAAAAERLRRDEYPPDAIDGTFRGGLIQDVVALANAYLELTDPTPIYDEWLESVGLLSGQNDLGEYFFLSIQPNLKTASVEFDNSATGDYYASQSELDLPRPTTRGQLRMLCRVLGIELKESDA